ncbi:MAG: DUF2271 domain-containing protein, partial [Myxococcales bacterium]|nr:DUF2271 domain-containing protein [Myxococcales bacterium]
MLRLFPICLLSLWAALPLIGAPSSAAAQERIVEFSFAPTARAQIALWLERADGSFVQTLALSESVAFRGIGNRPGAMQMNSGFRWPYGRREGVLPVWAHARAAAPGAELFERVIFQDRISEGYASRSSDDFSRDDYFCLSFNQLTTTRDALDAVSCASVFNSDKGRYLDTDDLASGYSEPYLDGTLETSRLLSGTSLYPPRRDVLRCTSPGCWDHPDVERYREDALRLMPELDAITMATPSGGSLKTIQLTVPSGWPDGEYVAWIEVNTEGD